MRVSEERMRGLQRLSSDVRLRRRAALEQIADQGMTAEESRRNAADAIDNPSEELLHVRVIDVIRAAKWTGRTHAAAILVQAGVATGDLRLGELTDNQRHRIARVLRAHKLHRRPLADPFEASQQAIRQRDDLLMLIGRHRRMATDETLPVEMFCKADETLWGAAARIAKESQG